MKLARRKFLQLGAGAAGAAATPALPRRARALDYPTRPVRVIVPFAPGGPSDIFGRLLAQHLSSQLKVSFFVENYAGAGGNIGAGRAAEAAPDGYTLLVDGANFVVNPSLYPQVPYDPFKNFTPVTLGVTAAAVLTVNPSLPVQSVKDLVALIKANPGKFSYASPGTGTPPQLVGELFRLTLGLDLVHVPFNGGGPPVAATVAGHTPLSFGSLAPAVPLVKDGKLRALAVTGKKRSPTLPDVPTMAEAGFPEIDGVSWFAEIAPAGTAPEIITLLYRESAKAINAPDMNHALLELGYEPVASTPEECAEIFKADAAKWAKVIRDAGIKAE